MKKSVTLINHRHVGTADDQPGHHRTHFRFTFAERIGDQPQDGPLANEFTDLALGAQQTALGRAQPRALLGYRGIHVVNVDCPFSNHVEVPRHPEHPLDANADGGFVKA